MGGKLLRSQECRNKNLLSGYIIGKNIFNKRKKEFKLLPHGRDNINLVY